MHAYLGIDIGTGGCKALVCDAAGRALSLAYREYAVSSPRAGWAQLDSDAVMAGCFEAIAEAAAAASGATVCALGISSQGEAFTPLDARDRPLCEAMVSSDARAAEYARTWPRQFGLERLYRITGHTPHPMFSLFKLLWLRDHRPDLWRRARRFLCFEDLLAFRLGLAPAMGWPLAGRTLLFDVCRHRWDADLLGAAGVQAEQLAAPAPSGSPVGHVAPAVARRLGLGDDVLVVAGGHDQCCGALGAGVTGPGRAMYATGSVECVTAAFSQPAFADLLRDSNLCTYDHAVAGLYATIAYSLTGGNLLRWFRDQFGAAEVAAARRGGRNAYERLLEACPDAPTSLLVLPYFTPTGTPYFDPDATGAILGLRLSTRREEILRALLEGVALEMRLNLEILRAAGCEVAQLRAIGGGARSAKWNQLKADVLGVPIVTLEVTEAGALGAALLACAAHTGRAATDLAAGWVVPTGQAEPRPSAAAVYAERFETYRQLYPRLRELRT